MTRRILVVGGNKGIGRDIVHRRRALDDEVFSTSRHPADGDSPEVFNLDVTKTNYEDLRARLASISPNIVIFNASMWTSGGLISSKIEEITDIGAFVTGSMLLTKAVLETCTYPARIIFMGSIVGSSGFIVSHTTPYSAFKIFLQALSEGVTAEGGGSISGSYLELGSFRPDHIAEQDQSVMPFETVLRTIDYLIDVPFSEKVPLLKISPINEFRKR